MKRRELPTYDQVKDLQVFRPWEAAVFLRVGSAKKVKRLPIRKARLGHRTVVYRRQDLLSFLEGRVA